mgnify:CR=1 FL=1
MGVWVSRAPNGRSASFTAFIAAAPAAAVPASPTPLAPRIVSPVGVATGAVYASLRKVMLTTDRPMLANEAIVFKVTRVMNPSSVTGTAKVVVKPKDSNVSIS